MMNKYNLTIITVIVIMLTGCGLKPSKLSPPEDAVSSSEYPRTYPNISTDPN